MTTAPLVDIPTLASIGPARLFAGAASGSAVGLPAHRRLHPAAAPPDRDRLTAALRDVRMLGRGGAGFPVARKLEALPAREEPGASWSTAAKASRSASRIDL